MPTFPIADLTRYTVMQAYLEMKWNFQNLDKKWPQSQDVFVKLKKIRYV